MMKNKKRYLYLNDDETRLVLQSLIRFKNKLQQQGRYGFEGRVEWCACFVSWCANECGYIENGIAYTMEGNSSDSCRQRQYSVGYYEILGYGIPAY